MKIKIWKFAFSSVMIQNLGLAYQKEGEHDSRNQIQSTLRIINTFKCWCFVLYSDY